MEVEVPPHNLEAERGVLGAVMLSGTALATIVALGVRPEHFWYERHGELFAAMLALEESDDGVDEVTLAQALRARGTLEEVGGAAYVDELASHVPAGGHVREHAMMVRDLAQRRAVITGSHEIREAAQRGELNVSDLLAFAERRMGAAGDLATGDLRSLPFEEELERANRVMTGEVDAGLATGYGELDSLVGGWQPGSLVVLAARPGMGKSALVVNLAEGALRTGAPVAMFSLEMDRGEILRRMLACNSGVRHEQILRGPITSKQFDRLVDATNTMSDWPLFVDEAAGVGIWDVRGRARRLHNRLPVGLGLVIVDYLQLLAPEDPRGNRVQEVAAMTRGLKTLARELAVPVICVSQLNRDLEKRADKRPQLADLRDSGAVEQDADMVLFLYREGYYDEESDPTATELNIAKHRNGRLGTVPLAFLAHYPKFAPAGTLSGPDTGIPF